jgi:hypothetical protein
MAVGYLPPDKWSGVKDKLTPTGPRRGTIVRQSSIAENMAVSPYAKDYITRDKTKGIVTESKKTNILNNYTSYNYKFTLASLPKKALYDSTFDYKNDKNIFVIAKSGGKTADASTPTASPEYDDLVQGFNKNSPGRFDFFINNVRINTVCGGSLSTNMSIATQIEFDLFEPYSMTGFIEALHVAAVSADHDSYLNCPFLLKLEFIGYRDDNNKIENIPFSRYFVFRFTQVEIDINETGTRYRCAGVPTNELGFSNNSGKLLDNVLCTGNTVKDLLGSLAIRINQQKQDEMELITKDSNVKSDHYEIIIRNDDNNLISDASTVNFLTQQQHFDFVSEEDKLKFITESPSKLHLTYLGVNEKGQKIYDPTPRSIAAQFGKGCDITEIIASIIRDSSYVRRILHNPTPDKLGYIDYFIVLVEVEDREDYNEYLRKPFRNYRYIVQPYKIHYSRIQPLSSVAIDTTVAAAYAQRSYNYLYTGQNVDIEKFRLKFNTLYYQAVPSNLGNKPNVTVPMDSVEGQTTPDVKLPKVTKKEVQKDIHGKASISTLADRSTTNIGAVEGQIDPFYDLAKSMHQGILENVDLATGELEIIGDPCYLLTDSIGNQRLTFDQTTGMISNGEVPYTYQDTNIVIRFNTPTDINEKTGFVYYETLGKTNTKVASYSGVFRVIQVNSTFNDGVFKQILQLVRIPGQLEDTSSTPSTPETVGTSPVAERTPSPAPPAEVSSMRATDNTLASTTQKLLKTSNSVKGLPGALSNLVPGGINSLAGAAAAGLTVASIINSLKSGASNNVGSLVNRVSGLPSAGLSNVGSSIRLANAGLSALSNNVNQVGGSVNEISNTAQSLGLSKVTPANLSKTLLANNNNLVNSLGSSQIAKVTNLSSQAAGLVSNVSSNVNNLNGNFAALEGQLGINSSVISGLSPNLKSRILKTITDAANKIPSNVDINAEIQNGLNINNLPIDGLGNIPPTQPKAIAPEPRINSSDLRYIVNRGGNLNNISGVSDISNLDQILSNVKLSNISSVGAKPQVVADKLSTIQAGLRRITNTTVSRETEINNVSNLTGKDVPNTGDLSKSAVSKYGSKGGSSAILTALIKATQNY